MLNKLCYCNINNTFRWLPKLHHYIPQFCPFWHNVQSILVILLICCSLQSCAKLLFSQIQIICLFFDLLQTLKWSDATTSWNVRAKGGVFHVIIPQSPICDKKHLQRTFLSLSKVAWPGNCDWWREFLWRQWTTAYLRIEHRKLPIVVSISFQDADIYV